MEANNNTSDQTTLVKEITSEIIPQPEESVAESEEESFSSEENEATEENDLQDEGSQTEDEEGDEEEEEFEADERSVHCLSRVCIKNIGQRAENRHFIVMKDGKPVHIDSSIREAFNVFEKLFLEVVLDELTSNRIILDHHLDTMECIFRTDIAVENRFLIISYPRHITTFELYMI